MDLNKFIGMTITDIESKDGQWVSLEFIDGSIVTFMADMEQPNTAYLSVTEDVVEG